MRCEYGGEVTFTTSEPGYRLRISNGSTISVILSKEEVVKLQCRIHAVLDDDQSDEEA